MKPQPRWVFIAIATVMILMTVASIGITGRKSASPYLLFWLAIAYWSFKRKDVELLWWLKWISIVNAAGLVLLLVVYSPDTLSFLGLSSRNELLISVAIPLATKLFLLFLLHKEQGGSMGTFLDIFRPGYKPHFSNTSDIGEVRDTVSVSAKNLKNFSNSIDQIPDECWKSAAEEYEAARDEALWAKSYAMSDGDDARTKATYIRLRALALSHQAHEGSELISPIVQKPNSFDTLPKRSKGGVVTISIAGLASIVILFFWIAKSGEVEVPSNLSTSQKNAPSSTANVAPDSREIVCKVYWDGKQIRSEKEEKRGYALYRLTYYGTEVHLALPREFANGLHGLVAPGTFVNNPNFNAFLTAYEQQILATCGLRPLRQ